jgi:hypothetical protein
MIATPSSCDANAIVKGVFPLPPTIKFPTEMIGSPISFLGDKTLRKDITIPYTIEIGDNKTIKG